MDGKELRSAKLTIDAVSELLDLGDERVGQLIKDGWIARDKSGAIRLGDAVRGYVKFLRSRSTRSASDTRVREARAREIELRTAQRAGELCYVEEALAICDEVFGGLRSDLGGLPATVTRDLSIRNEIETALDSILNKRSRQLEERAKTLARTASQVPQSNGRDLDDAGSAATRV
jgi:hypothetical protein